METEIVEKKSNIIESARARFDEMEKCGQLTLPANYSAANALNSAWLQLQEKKELLSQCTSTSIMNALLDMMIQGLNPSKKQCYFIKYGQNLTLQRSYFGTISIAKNLTDVNSIFARCVYKNDIFEYEVDPDTVQIVIKKHEQKLENINNKEIVAAYAVVGLENGEKYIEIMTFEQINKAWNMRKANGLSNVHLKFTEEMAKKTVINRALKIFVSSTSDKDIFVDSFQRTTENEYIEDGKEEKEVRSRKII